MNIPFNGFILSTYILLGLVMYGVFHGCHPVGLKNDQLLMMFLKTQFNWLPGLEGLFLAAIYSAGISTLTALYSALTTVFVEDVLVLAIRKYDSNMTLNRQLNLFLVRFLREFFSRVFADFFGFIQKKETYFSIFFCDNRFRLGFPS